jgi:hypothetical protein
MYEQLTCLICGNESKQTPAYFSQFVIWRTTGKKPDANVATSLSHCNKCDFYYATARFDGTELFRLYDGYRNDQYNQMRLECEPNYDIEMFADDYIGLRKSFINGLINKHTNGINSILDYGGGDGTYVPNVNLRCVYDVSGIDPIPGVLKYHLNNDYKFDLVMNCQVLEHVANIDEIIVKIKSHTKKYLYIEVPAYRDPPLSPMVIGEHINFFRESSLHALLNKHEIKIIDTAVDYKLKVLAVLGKI